LTNLGKEQEKAEKQANAVLLNLEICENILDLCSEAVNRFQGEKTTF